MNVKEVTDGSQLESLGAVKSEEATTTEKVEKDYPRLIAAQNEAARRIKIKSINNKLSEEHKKKVGFAIATGACLAGMVAAVHFSGVDPMEAIKTEVRALGSFEALKEYFETFTPAMWGGIISTAVAFTGYLKHSREYNKANQEFYDMADNHPTEYQDIVQAQAKNR